MKRNIGLSTILITAMAVVAAARQSTEPSLGFVSVQEDVNAIVCNDKDEQFTIVGSKEPALLPAGRYRIGSWTLKYTDKYGSVWKLTSKEITHKKTFYVSEGAETKLPMCEPIVSTLTVNKDDSGFYFRHYFRGQMGEELDLTKDQSRADPPKLLIRNKDCSYQETLTFKYG
jgi:hypothetical protein